MVNGYMESPNYMYLYYRHALHIQYPWQDGVIPPKMIHARDPLRQFLKQERPEIANYGWSINTEVGEDQRNVYYKHPYTLMADRMLQLFNEGVDFKQSYVTAMKEIVELEEERELRVQLAEAHVAELGVPNLSLHKKDEKENQELMVKNSRMELFADVLKDIPKGQTWLWEEFEFFLDDMELLEQVYCDYPELRGTFPPFWKHIPSKLVREHKKINSLEEFYNYLGFNEVTGTEMDPQKEEIQEPTEPQEIEHKPVNFAASKQGLSQTYMKKDLSLGIMSLLSDMGTTKRPYEPLQSQHSKPPQILVDTLLSGPRRKRSIFNKDNEI